MKKNSFLSFTLIFCLVFCSSFKSFSQEKPNPEKMQWFSDAKLGIFIHWGIYAVNPTSESWAFHNGRISHSDYMKQIKGFTASKYNPDEWADLIKKSGARYTVITTKHHDGVSLYDTKFNKLSIPRKSPAKKDVLTPFVDAIRKTDVKLGFYYSLIDWTHDDYPGFLRDSSKYDAALDPVRWGKFLKFCHGQIQELLDIYNPDLLWFDGDWEHSAGEWRADYIRKMILNSNPNAIINGRLSGFGDYDTPEQNFPLTKPNLDNWELCMTTNRSWGYRGDDDTVFKTPYEIISIFADVVGMGGNLLLGIGPREDGTIPQEQVNILSELGYWTGKHEEAIFGTLAGMPQGHFYGPTTISKDSTSLYLFVHGKTSGNIMLKGLMNTVTKTEILGSTIEPKFKLVGKISWSEVPGIIYIDIPENAIDKYMTVIKLSLDSPVKLYRGKGGLGL